MATNLLLEGEDLEALLMRAHAEAGPRARIVRASKVRRGGVLGFFAREAFEVAVEVPDDEDDDELLGGGTAPDAGLVDDRTVAGVPTGGRSDRSRIVATVSADVLEGVLDGVPAISPAAALAGRTVDPVPEALAGRTGPQMPAGMPTGMRSIEQTIELAIEQDAPQTAEELAETLQALVAEVTEATEVARPTFRAGLVDAQGREILSGNAFVATDVDDDENDGVENDGVENDGVENENDDAVDDEADEHSTPLENGEPVPVITIAIATEGGDDDQTDESFEVLATVVAETVDDLESAEVVEAAAQPKPKSKKPKPKKAKARSDDSPGEPVDPIEPGEPVDPVDLVTPTDQGTPTEQDTPTELTPTGPSVPEQIDESPTPVAAATAGINVLPSHSGGWFPTDGLLTAARKLSPAERAAARVLRIQADTQPAQPELGQDAETAAPDQPAETTAIVPAQAVGSRLPGHSTRREARAAAQAAADDDQHPTDDDTENGHWWLALETDPQPTYPAPRGVWSKIGRRPASDGVDREVEQPEPAALPGAHRISTQRASAERAALERALAEQLAAAQRAVAVRTAADPMAVAGEFVQDEIAEDLDQPAGDDAEQSRSMLALLRAGLRTPRHRQVAAEQADLPVALGSQLPTAGLGAAAAVLVAGRRVPVPREPVVIPAEFIASLSSSTTPVQAADATGPEAGPAAADPLVPAGGSDADELATLQNQSRRAARMAEAKLAAERRALRALGVPSAWTRRYRGRDRLSAVLAMLERMPQAVLDPDAPVVAVIGPAGLVELEAHRTALDLPVGNRPRPVVLVPGTTGPERSAALAGARKTRPVVVAIERAGLDDVVSVRRALRSAQPDLVIALIDARDRLEDITRWIESFDRVDAIALDCALEVADPAAALHLDLPVIRMDGIPVDRFGWAALLCAQLETLDCVR